MTQSLFDSVLPTQPASIFPSSFAQRQIWFLEQLASNGAGYNILNAYRLQGDLRIAALESSFATLLQRHQVLRTYFIDTEGQPQQVSTAIAESVIPVIDLQHLPNGLREAEARKMAEADAKRPFDLACPPLWRISLLQIDRAEYWLLFTVHHTIFDGWSCNIFADELLTLYQATILNQDAALPELPMQYVDFVQWQQQYLQGEVLDTLLKHWQQVLTPIPQPLDLPTDFPRPAQPSYRGTRMGIQLSASLTARLRVLSQQQHATLYMTLLTAFKVLLFRYTAQSDIAVGTPIANRLRPEFANLIGFFVNTLVLRSHIKGQQSFLQLLVQIRRTALAAYEHADLPFDVLVEALRPERDLSYNPLFQVMFQLRNQAPPLPTTPGLTCSPLTIQNHAANFDLTLEVQETDDGMIAEMEYSTDLFLPETVQRMLDHYAVLLEGIVANPQQPIAELPLLTLEELNQFLHKQTRLQSSDTASKTSQVQNMAQFQSHPKADLALTLKSTEAGLVGELVHAADRSQTAAIATILEQFSQHLRQLATNPDYVLPTHLDVLDLTDASVAQLHISWPSRSSAHAQDSAQQQPAIQCLHQYFEDQVRRTPDHVALYHRDQQLTYAELNAKANQIAHLLVKWGVQPDMPVGVCFERSLDMIVALFAVLKAGGAYLPLDPNYPQERLEYMIEDAQASVVLTQQGLRSRLPVTVQQVLCLDTDDVSAELAHVAQPLDNPVVNVKPHHLAYIIYTSGSTGKPKGVMIEHQAVAHFIKAAIARFQITDADCMLQFASISFDAAVEEIFTGLTTGASLYLRDEDMLGVPSSFLQACQERNITVLDLPTAYWHQLVTEIAANRAQLPPAVRLVIIGGERALPSLVKTWQQRVGDYPQLINTYGPTETTVTATSFQITQHASIRQEVPIGQPLANAEAYVLDEHGQPLPIGVAGELHIGGDSLARGYLNRPELTQEKFIPHPFSPKPNAKLYKTGDRVRYLADGSIEFLGRIDNQIKIRGFRVELGEIEAALLEYPGVRETIVVAQEDSLGSQQLVAYVVEYADQPISKPALRGFLQQSLPNYMVPAAIVSLDALPLTPNGKVDRRALPAPTFAEATEDAAFVAPRTPLEQTLATIWAETLKLPRVSVKDSFFELGGHSLQAVQMITRMMTELNVNLTLSTLFQAPTVEEMAHRLAAERAGVAWSPLVTFHANGSKRPFFAVHGGHGEVLFYRALAKYLGDDQPFYALRARGNDYPDMAHQQVQEMAACYIEAIRSVQPEGPYRIGGASLGGIVAFEMAQQLQAAGQTVEQLVVFDTGGFDDYVEPLPLHQRAINVLRYLPKYGAAETWKRLKIRLLKLFNNDAVVEFYRANGVIPDPNSPEIAVWEKIWQTNLAALDNYSPQVYPGKLTLLRAVDDGDYMWNCYQSDYGWGRYAAQGVDSYDVAGNHVGMFQEPHVQQLAQCLQQLLDTHP